MASVMRATRPPHPTLSRRERAGVRVLLKARSAEPLAQQGQDAFAVELEEAGLVRTWGVKDQVVEAKVAVVLDLLDMLFGVGRDDPALGRAFDRQRVGQALHLKRVVHRRLLLGRERERTPVLGVGERAIAV